VKTVVDTNVFVESLSATSTYHRIFKGLINGSIFICISNSILMEYEEVLRLLHRQENVERLLDFLTLSPFVIFVNPTFNFQLITVDPDDNKFVDCAIAAQVDYIITSDRHFAVLQKVEFPKVNIIHPEEFIKNFL